MSEQLERPRGARAASWFVAGVHGIGAVIGWLAVSATWDVFGPDRVVTMDADFATYVNSLKEYPHQQAGLLAIHIGSLLFASAQTMKMGLAIGRAIK